MYKKDRHLRGMKAFAGACHDDCLYYNKNYLENVKQFMTQLID